MIMSEKTKIINKTALLDLISQKRITKIALTELLGITKPTLDKYIKDSTLLNESAVYKLIERFGFPILEEKFIKLLDYYYLVDIEKNKQDKESTVENTIYEKEL